MSMLDRLNRLDRSTLTLGSIVLAIILFLCVNMIASLTLGSQRLDLTEERLFTVSDSTRRVLADLEEPITLRIYRTQDLLDSVPTLQVYAERVTQLLRTYQELSGGKITVEQIETLPFSEEEDRAIGYAIRGFQLNPTGERGYYGLVGTNSVDDLETIEFLTPAREPLLEYDLTRVIYRLAHPDDPQVAVIDGLGIFGSMAQGRYPWRILEMIDEDYQIEAVAPNARTIPEGTDVLVVIHPYAVPEATGYAIDQYVLGGGPTMVFLDPLADNSPPSMQNPREPMNPASYLEPLMHAWGVEMVPEKVVGDRNMALRVTGAAGMQRIVSDYVPWLQVRSDAFNQSDGVTAQLQLMRISSAGALRQIEGATTEMTPLIQTTTASMLYDELDVRRRPDPNVLLDKFEPSGERQVLAARVTGPARTAFPDGPPPPPEDAANQGELPEQVMESAGPVNLIIVSDTDLLADSHVANDRGQLVSDNANFVLNALENLAGGAALIDLRGRGLSIRPFTLVEQIQREAEATYRDTEQRLAQELEETQQRLAELLRPDQEAGGEIQSLTQEQQDTIAEFNRQMVDLRSQLRDVRAALRYDIEALEMRSKLLNILLIPAIIIVLGVVAALWRRARLARHLRRHQTA